MTLQARLRTATAIAVALLTLSGVGVAGARPDRAQVEAISRPSEDATLSFVRPGWIAKVLVKPGDAVKKGQLLIQMDDRAERVQLAKLKAEAGDTTRIRAAQLKLNLANVVLAKTAEAEKGGAATELEVQEKRLEMQIAQLSLELAQFQQAQAQREYEVAQAQLERMKLVSPIDGVVERVVIEEGESADANQNLIQIVKTDPLWIDVPVPTERVRSLKLSVNGPVTVELPHGAGEAPPPPVTGRILHVGQVADAGSRDRIVRVEMPNAAGRPAGEHVDVTFPEPPRLAHTGAKADGVKDTSPQASSEKE